ncbi:hypothetical protein NDU88_003184 [Pleurodeles waltl]|uniref:Transmembrane protein n=1 Tax=Pleurodeles waltl TaxID=8319 RepID=A0AAV7RD64_PLEWA|nr:hypothetical protein NDU88_003184 [Pleurodeles waltl]
MSASLRRTSFLCLPPLSRRLSILLLLRISSLLCVFPCIAARFLLQPLRISSFFSPAHAVSPLRLFCDFLTPEVLRGR